MKRLLMTREMRPRLLATLLALAPAAAAHAAGDRPISVTLLATSDNEAAGRLALLVREEFRASPHFNLAEDELRPGYVAHLNVMSGDGPARGFIAYSAILNFKLRPNGAESYLTSSVGICAEKSVEACSGQIYRALAAQAETFNTTAAKALERERRDQRRTGRAKPGSGAP